MNIPKSSCYFEIFGFRQIRFELHRRIELPLRLREPGKGIKAFVKTHYAQAPIDY